MLPLVEFVLSSFWRFVGFETLLATTLLGLAAIVELFRR
jgi:hypothetical protein